MPDTRPLRIAYLVDCFPALSETFVLNQITGLIARGHEVDIYASRPRPPLRLPDSARQYELPSRTHYRPDRPSNLALRLLKGCGLVARGIRHRRLVELRALNFFRYGEEAWRLKLLYSAAAHTSRVQYDIIHCHFGYWGLHGVILREIGAITGRLTTAFHGFDMSSLPRRKGWDYYKPLFQAGDMFMAVSERWRESLIARGAPADRTIVHRMGIDCDQFTFRERHLRAGEPWRLLTVGRLVEKKGVDDALRAIAMLIERGIEIEHTVVGGGPMRRELEELASSLNLGERIRFLGSQDHESVLQQMKRADILVAPSVTALDGDQEGIPVVLMEAMASGLPVVSTLHSGIPELVEDGVSGFLVPERAPEDLADKLETLWSHSSRWPAMGRAGREHVQQQYNIERLNDRLVSLWNGLLLGTNQRQQPPRA